jgi:excisionase family DNA binding protein
MEDKILTIKQASQFLKLNVSTINKLIAKGTIPSYKIGKRRLFDRDDLIRWFRRHRNDKPKKPARGKSKKRGGKKV